ncbi:MAG: NAD-binding protein [Chloroflexota bacterium]|nr:MAG: NAD-binding protein [Chloroflexota bacterium]
MKPIKSSWRQNLRHWWQKVKWPVLISLAIFSLILGYIGFARYAASRGENPSVLDLVYQTLQLVSMNSGLVPGPINWQLQLARFLIPALTVYTALSALALIFSEQIQFIKLWRIKDHVVICGLGRKGILLVEQFRALDMEVVVLEQDEGNDWLESSRSMGAVVLVGNASDPDLLHQANVERAKYLVSVMGDDGANAEIAVRAEEITRERTAGVLTCLIHIVDPQLYDLLREKELEHQDHAKFRLELFNIYDRGARLIIKYGADADNQEAARHILVIGIGKLGEGVVLQAIKDWRENNSTTGERLQITVIDRYADLIAESLCVRYPQLEQVCELVPLPMEIPSTEFLRADFLHDQPGQPGVEKVIVCLDNDSLGLQAGLSLAQQMENQEVPVIIRTSEDTGLATLLEEGGARQGSFQNLHAFGLLNQTCTADLVIGGTHEILARELHAIYLSDHTMPGAGVKKSDALVPWEQLPESLKESNRVQAANIGNTLAVCGYRITRLRDWDASEYQFSPDEVEKMAHWEHERWCNERWSAGWTRGDERDEDKKTNPDLVDWEVLEEQEREKNRRYVRGLPRSLAKAGFQVENHH